MSLGILQLLQSVLQLFSHRPGLAQSAASLGTLVAAASACSLRAEPLLFRAYPLLNLWS